jgi:hypothetical protein
MEGKLTPIAADLTPAAVSFHNKSGTTVGKFILDGDKLRFEGDADKSAKIFIKLVLKKFNKK